MQTVSELGSFRLCNHANLEDEAQSEVRAVSVLTRNATMTFAPRGMLLTGSLARGEGTIMRDDAGRARWLSDMECLVVFDDLSRQTRNAIRTALAQICAEINREPARCAKGLKVDLNPIEIGQLARMRPTIFSHELAEHGKLLWGEPSTILLPTPHPQTSLCHDGFRLLNNRIMELLKARAQFEFGSDLFPFVGYALTKLWRELGTSVSTFIGCYRTTYHQRRAELLRALPALENELGDVAHVLAARLICSNASESALVQRSEHEIIAEFVSATVAAAKVWRWETARLMGGKRLGRGWRDVSARLRKTEKFSDRMRDWGRAVLRGTIEPYLRVRSLAVIARAGSLGSAIYTAGCLLCFHWDEIGANDNASRDIIRLVSDLFEIEPNFGTKTRQILAQRTYQAWDHHLRRSAI
jgi:hypothetical protein